MKTFGTLTSLLALSLALSAQRPASAPATALSGKPPDTVFLEELTWAEVRDLVAAGTTTVIIGTAGTEQKGPHMVDGEHKFAMEYAADRIARALGRTLVAPVVTYVPEGSWDPPTGHMTKPGTITLPEDRFVELLVHAGRSLKAGGFRTILLLGDSGGNRGGMRTAVARLTDLWKGTASAFWIDDYYTKGHADQNRYITDKVGIPQDQIGGHANIVDTSIMLFVNPKHVRKNKLAPGGGYENSGVSGDPTKATPALGKIFLQLQIDDAVAQIKGLMSALREPQGATSLSRGGSIQAASAVQPGESRGGAARGRGGPSAGSGQAGSNAPREPTAVTAPAGRTPSQAPDTAFIEELTWEETRDAIRGGRTTVIIPIGGTEKNGYHMVLGKHNYVVTYAANLMARRLKNALVAPTLQYVPEGDPETSVPGEISLPSPAYDMVLDAAARSLSAHGFTDILFIGDSGGNQAGMRSVAARLNDEWKGRNVGVFALDDYYDEGRVHYRAWLQAAFGYDDTTVGTHAGISDTSQLLFVRPSGVRKDQIKPWGGPQDSGVSGDPAKATAEIGRMGLEFKVNAAINQYKRLKAGGERREAGAGRAQGGR
jgi:creatinine amidohydrolase/Fe(II)-dependent formamide hydrolase-like protein